MEENPKGQPSVGVSEDLKPSVGVSEDSKPPVGVSEDLKPSVGVSNDSKPTVSAFVSYTDYWPFKKKPPQVPKADIIERLVGQIGLVQFWVYFLIFLNKVPIAFHQMAIIFLAPQQSFVCADTLKKTCPCTNPVFDTSEFTNTIIMRWNLICENAWLVGLVQMLFQLGTLIGSFVFGIASDRFGRRLPILVAVVLQLVFGVATSYVPYFWAFLVVRFVVGVSVGGTMVIGFVILLELWGKDYREVISASYQIPFNLGHIGLPIISYLTRDYVYFQLALSLYGLILLPYICVLSESPRWLLAVNKTDEAVLLLEKYARINRRPTDHIQQECKLLQSEKKPSEMKKGTVADLFKTPRLRKNILCMSANWLVCSYCFYGVSQYVGHLGGNVFENVLASACMGLLGSVLSIPLMKFMGRRPVIIINHLVCSICLLAITGFEEGNTVRVALACIGVISSFIVFILVYLYSSELFPTVVRSAAVGVSSMSARIGSMIAPFVVSLNDVSPILPPIFFGIMPIIAAFLCYLLPETRGKPLMSSIQEAEDFGRKEKKSATTQP